MTALGLESVAVLVTVTVVPRATIRLFVCAGNCNVLGDDDDDTNTSRENRPGLNPPVCEPLSKKENSTLVRTTIRGVAAVTLLLKVCQILGDERFVVHWTWNTSLDGANHVSRNPHV